LFPPRSRGTRLHQASLLVLSQFAARDHLDQPRPFTDQQRPVFKSVPCAIVIANHAIALLDGTLRRRYPLRSIQRISAAERYRGPANIHPAFQKPPCTCPASNSLTRVEVGWRETSWPPGWASCGVQRVSPNPILASRLSEGKAACSSCYAKWRQSAASHRRGSVERDHVRKARRTKACKPPPPVQRI
jgi:hypothetical protein